MYSNLTIRTARKNDVNAIIALAGQLAKYENIKSFFRRKDYFMDGFGRNRYFETLVACHKNKIIGYVSFHKGYDIQSASRGIYLIDLFVTEEYRGRTVGTALMKAVGQQCRKTKGKWISWHVAHTNTRAIRFYEQIKAQRTHSFQYVMESDNFPK